jgi:pimeloyl-ACP methyl ester carboxylesterase
MTAVGRSESPAGRSESPVERTVAIRDGAVAFRVLEAGRGAPLVWLHSTHDAEAWPPLLERLAARYRVIAPRHPGSGGSTGVESLDDLLDLVLAYDELLTVLGLGAAHLAGHFFGAMVAAEVAAVLPRRVGRLVLVSPLGLWRDDAPPADVLILPKDDLAAVLWADPGSAAARAWASVPGDEDGQAVAEIESIARRSAMAKFVWPIPDRGITKRLHRIAAPTLLVWGDADRANPIVYAEEWQRRIKGAAVKVLPGGHMLPHESPAVVAAAMEEFLG